MSPLRRARNLPSCNRSWIERGFIVRDDEDRKLSWCASEHRNTHGDKRLWLGVASESCAPSLRSGRAGLPAFMRRLLTGTRLPLTGGTTGTDISSRPYKSIVCDEDSYSRTGPIHSPESSPAGLCANMVELVDIPGVATPSLWERYGIRARPAVRALVVWKGRE